MQVNIGLGSALIEFNYNITILRKIIALVTLETWNPVSDSLNSILVHFARFGVFLHIKLCILKANFNLKFFGCQA